VLLDVLRVGVVHQPPPSDELHSRKISKKMTHGNDSQRKQFIGVSVQVSDFGHPIF
jgi:hypothetical protein